MTTTRRLLKDTEKSVNAIPEVESCKSKIKSRGHVSLFVKLKNGREFTLTMSGTPKRADITVKNVVQDVKRYISGRY